MQGPYTILRSRLMMVHLSFAGEFYVNSLCALVSLNNHIIKHNTIQTTFHHHYGNAQAYNQNHNCYHNEISLALGYIKWLSFHPIYDIPNTCFGKPGISILTDWLNLISGWIFISYVIIKTTQRCLSKCYWLALSSIIILFLFFWFYNFKMFSIFIESL